MPKAKRKAKPRTLTGKQAAFVREYLKDANGTQAAIRAGYSAKSAHRLAHELLKNHLVRDAVAAGVSKAADKAELTAARVLKEISRIGFADPADAFDAGGHLLPVRDMPEDIRRVLSSVKVKRIKSFGGDAGIEEDIVEVRFWSKDSALDKLAKHLGLYRDDQTQPSSRDGATVNVTINAANIVQAALTQPDYLDYLRNRALAEDRDAGPVRPDGEPRPLEAGPAPGGDRPPSHSGNSAG